MSEALKVLERTLVRLDADINCTSASIKDTEASLVRMKEGLEVTKSKRADIVNSINALTNQVLVVQQVVLTGSLVGDGFVTIADLKTHNLK